MTPFRCPPPGCYPPVTETWELTNEWTGRSTLVHSSHLQPPQWSQEVWDNVMVHTGVPKYALEQFHSVSSPKRRFPCFGDKSQNQSRGRDKAITHPSGPGGNGGRSRSKSRGRTHDTRNIHKEGYKDHVPSKQDFTLKKIERKPSEKELKSILKRKDTRIFFDDAKGPYHAFNTFSDHPVMYQGFKYATAEHLLLYLKFAEWPKLADFLRKQPTVPKLWEAAGRHSDKKSSDWKQNKQYYMELVLWHKFTYHIGPKNALLSTDERSITFVSSTDSFWGAGIDGKGKNYLGKALEKTRGRIRTSSPPARQHQLVRS